MIAYYIVVAALMFAALLMQLKRDLMMLQQNSYRNERFSAWMSQTGESTRFDRLIGWAVFLIALLPQVSHQISLGVIAAFAVFNFIRLAIAKYKKPLVFTPRAIRIYTVQILLVAAVALLPIFFIGGNVWIVICFYMVFAYSCSYVYAQAANWLLKPVEAAINKKYYNEAASMLKSMPDLKIIGITGSYGKTSTKHFLHRILSEHFDTLMTPGNFNTTLGVIRTVREHMKPYNEVFIVEMGAKERGDIKEICDLVHPSIGIITAVGPMHLDTFHNMEGVQATKFELADSLPADGLAVVNNDFEHIANRKVDNVECLRYTAEGNAHSDYAAANVSYSATGTSFDIVNKAGDTIISLNTKLVGRSNISNLIAAVIVALRLGVPADKIRYAVEKIQQVEHRLSMNRLPSGIVLIDDAYNSNPVGSKMALEVLSGMTDGKRIVITPGMVELGDKQHQLNEEFGRAIAKSADVAIIVGNYNKDAILEGLKAEGFDMDNAITAATFLEANDIMLKMAKRGDTVLLENDLPDTYK